MAFMEAPPRTRPGSACDASFVRPVVQLLPKHARGPLGMHTIHWGLSERPRASALGINVSPLGRVRGSFGRGFWSPCAPDLALRCLTDSFCQSGYNGEDRTRRGFGPGPTPQSHGGDGSPPSIAKARRPKQHKKRLRCFRWRSVGAGVCCNHMQADVAQLVEQLIRNQ